VEAFDKEFFSTLGAKQPFLIINCLLYLLRQANKIEGNKGFAIKVEIKQILGLVT